MENMGNFFVENPGCYARSEEVPRENADGAEESNGEPGPGHGYGWSVRVALPAAPL